MKIKIFQIDPKKDTNHVKFHNHEMLKKYQDTDAIDASIYEEVYDGEVDTDDLEEVYTLFNQTAVPLHRGHSLSISDVIQTESGTAYYCDLFGFKPIDFDASLAYKPDDLLRVLYVEPHKRPVITEMARGLDAIQRAVKGYYEQVYLDKDTVLLCNEEGKLNGMEGNRRYNDGKSIIAGPFVVIGCGEEEYASLTDEQIEKYMQKFGKPEDISEEETLADIGVKFYG